MKTIYERFEEKYEPEPNTGCWLWAAYATRMVTDISARFGGT